ncbi:hypothetical protein ACH5RR_027616 [Cinchona calisaya]|uniref:Uncharacterized protein n=1 Tax=Cinchona calisaya TaxID=153742 RepID=A0ABD2Z7R4_9GENT
MRMNTQRQTRKNRASAGGGGGRRRRPIKQHLRLTQSSKPATNTWDDGISALSLLSNLHTQSLDEYSLDVGPFPFSIMEIIRIDRRKWQADMDLTNSLTSLVYNFTLSLCVSGVTSSLDHNK